MAPPPILRSTRLADRRVNPPAFVPATIISGFPCERLLEVEEAWSPVRVRLAASLEASGVGLEHGHWDWTRKADRVNEGELVLLAIECEGEIQGLMAVSAGTRPSVLVPGQSLVYVEYLEAAPWNQNCPAWPQRFQGAGRVLMASAIQRSLDLGLGGRVGLHSLPQATEFYRSGCGMTSLGPDSGYYDLMHFEYTEGAGTAWLRSVRAFDE